MLSKQDDGGAASCMRSWIAIPASAARRLFQPVRSRGLSRSGPKSQPYGIVFAKDAICYSESAANRVEASCIAQSLDRELCRGACELSPSRFKT